MKKKFSTFAAILLAVLVIGFIGSAATGCHYTTKYFGGEMTVELSPGQKLEEITWKDDSLWILSRPMRDDETPETHIFYENSEFGVLEGTITVIEKEEQ